MADILDTLDRLADSPAHLRFVPLTREEAALAAHEIRRRRRSEAALIEQVEALKAPRRRFDLVAHITLSEARGDIRHEFARRAVRRAEVV